MIGFSLVIDCNHCIKTINQILLNVESLICFDYCKVVIDTFVIGLD